MVRRLSLTALACLALSAQENRYDVVITGAKVIDGSGTPWYFADIGIRGDTIAAIGQLASSPSATRIDARGMVVAPGFIDIHSHGRRGIGRLLVGSDAEQILRLAPVPVLLIRA